MAFKSITWSTKSLLFGRYFIGWGSRGLPRGGSPIVEGDAGVRLIATQHFVNVGDLVQQFLKCLMTRLELLGQGLQSVIAAVLVGDAVLDGSGTTHPFGNPESADVIFVP